MLSTHPSNYPELEPSVFLDCRHEVVPVRSTPSARRIWFGKDIVDNDWLFRFDSATLDEIRRACDFIATHPVADKQRHPTDLALPLCEEHFKKMCQVLDNGVGFCVADRLPVDDYPLDILVELYWVLGQYIGNPVAQKRKGQMIYDVRDTNKTFSYGVRGSWTNVELNFHTDNAFGKKPPHYVGLFCRHTAKSGGISRFCSLYALH